MRSARRASPCRQHNHGWAYRNKVGGTYVYEVLLDELDPTIFFELDTVHGDVFTALEESVAYLTSSNLAEGKPIA